MTEKEEKIKNLIAELSEIGNGLVKIFGEEGTFNRESLVSLFRKEGRKEKINNVDKTRE